MEKANVVGHGTRPDAPSRKGKAGQSGKAQLSMTEIDRRVQAIKAMTEDVKIKRSRQHLVRTVLEGIADGRIKQPTKAAQAVVEIMPNKKTTSTGRW